MHSKIYLKLFGYQDKKSGNHQDTRNSELTSLCVVELRFHHIFYAISKLLGCQNCQFFVNFSSSTVWGFDIGDHKNYPFPPPPNCSTLSSLAQRLAGSLSQVLDSE